MALSGIWHTYPICISTYSNAYHITDEVELNNDINYEEYRSEAILVVGIHHHIGKAEGMNH